MANVDLEGFWFLKEFSNGYQNATQVSLSHKDQIKAGYIFPLFKFVGGKDGLSIMGAQDI